MNGIEVVNAAKELEIGVIVCYRAEVYLGGKLDSLKALAEAAGLRIAPAEQYGEEKRCDFVLLDAEERVCGWIVASHDPEAEDESGMLIKTDPEATHG